jgi:BarA-like signal transduction histidine kinase
MINLTSFEDRHYSYVQRNAHAAREMRMLLCELSMDAVHPGNMGALPPCPDVLIHKARVIGLVGQKEERILRGF